MTGDGLYQASVGQFTSFRVETCNSQGIRYDDGGDPYLVQVRVALVQR